MPIEETHASANEELAVPTSIRLEKIYKELEKGTIYDQKIAYQNIKEFIAKKVEEASKQAEEIVNEHQTFLEKINGTKG